MLIVHLKDFRLWRHFEALVSYAKRFR